MNTDTVTLTAPHGDVFDPATGRVTKRVPFASAEDVSRAVAAAVTAQPAWGRLSLGRRAQVLFSFRELVVAHRDELAAIITSEHGKTFDDARGEVTRGLEVVEFACGLPHLLKGEFSENVGTDVDSHSLRQPLGVCAGITPFNFPAMVPMWMFPVALACGNAFVLKPSEKDPSTAVRLSELLAEAGLPDGVFHVIFGDRVAVDALLTHPDIASVSFVGSTPVANHVYATAAAHGKRVQALGGAKNHGVVLPDADLDVAADAIASAAFGSAGQRCMALSVAVAVGEIADELVAALAARADAVTVGAGASPGTDMGPLVTPDARDRVVSYVEAGVRDGATLVRDGRDVVVDGGEDGFFVGPTLFDGVDQTMSIYRDEIFGPVLVVMRANTAEEALAVVNANDHANGVAVFTADGRAAREFSSRVEVGMVGVNVPIPVPVAYHSFGGWKDSLNGDLHMHGPDGVRFFTRAKVVTSRWPERADGAEYSFPTHR